MLLLGRTALFENPGAAQIYYNNTRTDLEILQYKQLIDPKLTITEPTWNPRATYFDEHVLEPQYNTAANIFLQTTLRNYPEYKYVFKLKPKHFLMKMGMNVLNHVITVMEIIAILFIPWLIYHMKYNQKNN